MWFAKKVDRHTGVPRSVHGRRSPVYEGEVSYPIIFIASPSA